MYFAKRHGFGVARAGMLVFPPAPNPCGKGYVVQCVLVQSATGFIRWAVCVDDRTLKYFTMQTLPDFLKDAVTLIAPIADKHGLRSDNQWRASGDATDSKIYPSIYKEIGWFSGVAKFYPNPVEVLEEQLFSVVVTAEELEELRKTVPDYKG